MTEIQHGHYQQYMRRGKSRKGEEACVRQGKREGQWTIAGLV